MLNGIHLHRELPRRRIVDEHECVPLPITEHRVLRG
jgi:hypothetical protein